MSIVPEIRENEQMPNNRGIKSRYDWKFLHEMDVDQSAHFDIDDDEERERFRRAAASMAYSVGKRHDKTFSVQRTSGTSFAIWRVA